MSKRNLSKSAIEGGRAHNNKWRRRHSSKTERANMHTFISSIQGDYESFDEFSLPKRKKVYKEFTDKLSPLERWLDTRVGKSWNKTYSLIKERFDSRTTPGRHIINDHILRDVWRSLDKTTPLAKYHKYFVDAGGILRKTPSYRKEYEEIHQKMQEEKSRIQNWLNGRMIGKVGNVLYWYIPTVNSTLLEFDWYLGRYNICYHRKTNGGFVFAYDTRFLRSERLRGGDIDFFTKLFPFHKEALLKNSDILTRCTCNHGIQQHLGGLCQIPECKCNVKWV